MYNNWYITRMLKKNEICERWMNLESIILSGMTQTQKDKNHMFSYADPVSVTFLWP